jgi:hypothetical protein
MQTELSPADRRLRFHGFALRIAVATLGLITLLLFSSFVVSLIAQERRADDKPAPIELKSVAPDLTTPSMKVAAPAPGTRVKQQVPEFEGTSRKS